MDQRFPFGPAKEADGRWTFRVWAPRVKNCRLILRREGQAEWTGPMEGGGDGWFRLTAEAQPGDEYAFAPGRLDERPDPASHRQPGGVHGPSALVDHEAFAWTETGFVPPPLEEWVFYELHAGCFTQRGTLAAAAEKLDYLADLGITAVQLMPLSAFPGKRNWGYDGVQPFCVQETYGGPNGLKAFVDRAHELGLAVVLDMVHNHFGPEGCYVADFGPFFTSAYRTPWGKAVNLDGADSDEVRAYFIQTCLHFARHYHVDGFRLDAVHALHDHMRPAHFLADLSEAVHGYGREIGKPLRLIAETHANDPALTRPRSRGGRGLDSAYSDDLHHALHAIVTGERQGYYQDYGSLSRTALALERGFAFTGQHAGYYGRAHGAAGPDLPGTAHTVYLQTHDFVGNRLRGERLHSLVPAEAAKAATGLWLLSPFLPLFFMGQEWGEEKPFLYFVDHTDPGLLEAVRKGRRREFSRFKWHGEPPDPSALGTYLQCKLDWQAPAEMGYRCHLRFTRELLAARREHSALARLEPRHTRVTPFAPDGVLVMERGGDDGQKAVVVANLSDAAARFTASRLLPPGSWRKTLEAAEERFGGPGPSLPLECLGGEERLDLPPYAFALYVSA
ncbi:malto-oligosyltrehalose trehalohydrolase [Desulfohalovibrio reitneri]|uniref:malto-oligosyltrehalose trehalohydrolase n=1 Tax=Desulfohalovibrio reitneri TaxID=1307759 RepID=UPI0004A76D78|nr:malto-oligosyltrehalose trehalohydrolase [Desulfohalovibrio reitneri]